jgi:N-methylhydantoinase A/oxoprolinase/acetone carboxylase beta subunit
MPDLISIGLGGGSLVRRSNGNLRVGPDSVGYRLEEEAIVFGGKTLTATDIAVAMGRASLGDPKRLAKVTHSVAKPVDRLIRQMIEGCIDRLKLSPAGVPVVLVGGGSILLPNEVEGASEIHRPQNYDVANAIGVAIAPVSAEIDRLFSYTQFSRQEALREAQKLALDKAHQAGADPNNTEIVEVEEIAMAYLPEHAVRIKVKAAGPLYAISGGTQASVS